MSIRPALFVVFVFVLLVSGCNSKNATSNQPNLQQSSTSPTASPTATPLVAGPIRITSPADGQTVKELPIIEGTVADASARVWVVVHPMETADYWVQPRTTVRDDARWRVQIHIGMPGIVDVGKHFELRAVANPKQSLSDGLILPDWPEAQFQSQVIEVVRGN